MTSGGASKIFSRLAIARHILRPCHKLCCNSTIDHLRQIPYIIVATLCMARWHSSRVPDTRVLLSPSSIIWYQSMGGGKVTVGLVSHTLVVRQLQAQVLEEGDEHPLYSLVEHDWLYLTTWWPYLLRTTVLVLFKCFDVCYLRLKWWHSTCKFESLIKLRWVDGSTVQSLTSLARQAILLAVTREQKYLHCVSHFTRGVQ